MNEENSAVQLCYDCKHFEVQLCVINNGGDEPVFIERGYCIHPELKIKPLPEGFCTPEWCPIKDGNSN